MLKYSKITVWVPIKITGKIKNHALLFIFQVLASLDAGQCERLPNRKRQNSVQIYSPHSIRQFRPASLHILLVQTRGSFGSGGIFRSTKLHLCAQVMVDLSFSSRVILDFFLFWNCKLQNSPEHLGLNCHLFGLYHIIHTKDCS